MFNGEQVNKQSRQLRALHFAVKSDVPLVVYLPGPTQPQNQGLQEILLPEGNCELSSLAPDTVMSWLASSSSTPTTLGHLRTIHFGVST